MQKKAVVCHSGGMDSSLCLALALREFDADEVLSMGFTYGQRHLPELEQAAKICRDWNVDRVVVNINCLQKLTTNALMNSKIAMSSDDKGIPNTLVVGRNGLMARLCAIHADDIGAQYIYMGVMELEEANSGYRDCSCDYMNLMEQILRIDLDNPRFEIRTPLIMMTKKETMDLGYELGVLEYLLQETITCYDGVPGKGCERCPACLLRNQGIDDFLQEHPHFSYKPVPM